MHPVYTREQLLYKVPATLKAIASELGVDPSGDKRCKETWIDAILEYQSGVEPAAPVEFDQPSWNYCECLVDGQEIAIIQYDGIIFKYVVWIDGVEAHQSSTMAQAQGYIMRHHKDGTLPQVAKEEQSRISEPVGPYRLLIGDVIIWDNKSWKVEEINMGRAIATQSMVDVKYEIFLIFRLRIPPLARRIAAN
ncbi:MAG: hypothetical protein KatS3mg087_0611 [Patescibacteria group bacterium]|nr:MAG: hypothetical protein KatS3mg087_0611 [Patescibacteria group bacterium]